MPVCLSILLQEPGQCGEHICWSNLKHSQCVKLASSLLLLTRAKTFPQTSAKSMILGMPTRCENSHLELVGIARPLPVLPGNDMRSLSTLSKFYLVNVSVCQVPGGVDESSRLCLLWYHLSTEAKSPGHCPYGMPTSLFPLLAASGKEVSEPP